MARIFAPLLVIGTLAALVAVILMTAVPAPAEDPVSEVPDYTFVLQVEGQAVRVPCYVSRPLEETQEAVERVVVLVHGNSRNASGAWDTLEDAASIAGAVGPSVLLLAPQFLIEVDVEAHGLPPDRLYWSHAGWKQGDQSLDTAAHPRSVRASSFAVMDSLLGRVVALSPNLETLVLAGHSAGGQFVQRFAAGSALAEAFRDDHGVEVVYVVANPSSYLYFNAERAVTGAPDRFEVPPLRTRTTCPGWDDYKYGLENRNSYMGAIPAEELRERYRTRKVTYLLGERDDDPNGDDLDETCPASLQGKNRLERGLVYRNYLRHAFGLAAIPEHRTFVVPGVEHSSRQMFTSDCGVAQLFGGGACDALAGAISSTLLLGQNFPNPFRGQTTILFRLLESSARVTLTVFDPVGRRVRTLLDGPRTAGPHSIEWDGLRDDGRRAPAGVYFYRLERGSEQVTKRITYLR